jgi:hypothetical protein
MQTSFGSGLLFDIELTYYLIKQSVFVNRAGITAEALFCFNRKNNLLDNITLL